ncbi:hypothetical protein SSYM_2430 [Serratia symbiotica str. Tucson]|uniref:Uncharacterized protein n=1 Tax=Serratia symbiotica str. Tucson TaxID=914128 RepID=E9CPH7_9GAMM|nr:hypothetical protein SSYM_2430 [Serratia symbiotica str. Tucson]
MPIKTATSNNAYLEPMPVGVNCCSQFGPGQRAITAAYKGVREEGEHRPEPKWQIK